MSIRKCAECGVELIGRKKRNKMFCSAECMNTSKITRERRSNTKKGEKQSAETIQKRILNTDQKTKELKRKQTMLDRYGVTNWAETDDGKESLSQAHLGSKKPRTSIHQLKIIESKRKNGTLNHTDDAKKKMSESTIKYFDSLDDRSCHIHDNPNSHKNHKTGYVNGIFCRSSYEIRFLELCETYGVEVISAERKEFSVEYYYKGKRHTYYPDFVVNRKTIIEVKPKSMINVGANPCKIRAAKEVYGMNYIVVTEYEIENSFWISMI